MTVVVILVAWSVAMTAEIIVLADVRAQRASVTVKVSADPYACFWSWFCFWTGDKPRARETKNAEVRSIGGGR